MFFMLLAVPFTVFAAALPAKIQPVAPLPQRLAAVQKIQQQQSLTYQTVALLSASRQYGGLIGKQLADIAESHLLAAQTMRNDLQQTQRAGLPALVFGPVDTRALTLVKGDLLVTQARLQQLARVRDEMAFTYAKTLVGGAINGLDLQRVTAQQQVWKVESRLGVLNWFK